MDDIKKGDLQDPELLKAQLYNNGDIAIVNNIKEFETTIPADLAIQMKIYVVILLLDGKASIDLNGTTYTLYKDDLLVCTPNNIVQKLLTSLDFKCYCICISPTYLSKISPISKNAWDVKILFEKKPVYTLKSEEVITFSQYYNLLCSKMNLPSSIQTKVIDALMTAFLYDMQNILNRMVKEEIRSFTSGEYLFKQFIGLLENSFPKSRRVDFYADKLHVSSKYLSSVCKKCSGKPSSKIIDIYVQKDVEHLLRHTMKNIKEIAFQLDFPSLSFFGKYVRKHFGMSPRLYRENAIKNTK